MRVKITLKIISTVLLVSFLLYNTCIPVFADTSITFSDFTDSKHDTKNNIELFRKEKLYITNSGNIGIKGNVSNPKEFVILVDTSGNLDKVDKSFKSPFDYCLFSGSQSRPLDISGNTVNITGSIHSNQDINYEATLVNCTTTEYVGEKNVIKSSVVNTNFVKSAPVVMPDIYNKLIDPTVNKFSIRRFTPVDTDSNLFYVSFPSNPKDNLKDPVNSYNINDISDPWLSYKSINGKKTFYVEGAKPFDVKPDTSYFFDGNLFLTNGVKFNGKGMICATGDIIIDGGSLDTEGSDAFIYSQSGRIEVKPQISTFNGILYAPTPVSEADYNPGAGKDGLRSVKIQGESIKVNGSIIGDSIYSIPGNLTITYRETTIEAVETVTEIPNTYLYISTQTAQNFIKAYAGQPARFGVLTYDESANNNDFTFEDMEAIDPNLYKNSNTYKKLSAIGNTKHSSGKSNLGDGLRRAYWMLKNSGNASASKFIIVITGSVPNRWTQSGNSEGYSPMLGTGNAVIGNIKANTTSLNKASQYAIDIGKEIISDNIVPIFINSLPTDETNWESVDKAFREVIVPEIQKTTSSASDQLYYSISDDDEDTGFLNQLNRLIQEKVKKFVDINILNVEVVFTFNVPQGVSVYGEPDSGKWTRIKDTANVKQYSLNTSLVLTDQIYTPDPSIKLYKFTDPLNLDFVLKYTNLKKITPSYNDTVTFANTDNFEYKITYPDPIDPDKTVTYSITNYCDNLNVNVTYKIDQQ